MEKENRKSLRQILMEKHLLANFQTQTHLYSHLVHRCISCDVVQVLLSQKGLAIYAAHEKASKYLKIKSFVKRLAKTKKLYLYV